MDDKKIDAAFSLYRGGRLLVGRDRLSILEAVGEHGSITKAAQALGFSYKAGWDAINALNNLMPRPACILRTGGKSGGGAVITSEGRRLIQAFRRLEEKLSEISAVIAEEGFEGDQSALFWGVGLRTSARNALYCQVIEVRREAVDVQVTLRISDSNRMTTIVTNGSADNLGLEAGQSVVALIKSSAVMLSRVDDIPRISARNRLVGTVLKRVDGDVNAEITLDIGDNKTFTSVITRAGADDLEIEPGDAVCAMFKASHVILAVA